MQQNKPITQTTSAKANGLNSPTATIIGALSGLSSIGSAKTGAERAEGIAQTIAKIATLFV